MKYNVADELKDWSCCCWITLANAWWVCWRKTQWHLHSSDNKSRNELLVDLFGLWTVRLSSDCWIVITWPKYRFAIGCMAPRYLPCQSSMDALSWWFLTFYNGSILESVLHESRFSRLGSNAFSLLIFLPASSLFSAPGQGSYNRARRVAGWNPSENKPKFTDFTNSKIVESISTT